MLLRETRQATQRCLINPPKPWPDWYRPPTHGARPEDWPADPHAPAPAGVQLNPVDVRQARRLEREQRRRAQGQVEVMPIMAHRREQQAAAEEERPSAAVVEPALATFRMVGGLPVFDLNAAAMRFLPPGAQRVSARWMGASRITVYRNVSSVAKQLIGVSGRGVPALDLLSERLGHGLQLGERFAVVPHPGNDSALIIDLSLALQPERSVFR